MNKLKEWFCNLMSKIFKSNKVNEEDEEKDTFDEAFIESLQEEISEGTSEQVEYIKENKSIIKKLNFLNNRIRIFETMFPDEYVRYKLEIDNYMKEYQKELDEYEDAYINRKVAFVIDPEKEYTRANSIYDLENNINTFIDREVKFKTWIINLSEFCYKLNILYNVSLNNSDKESIFTQTTRAICNLEKNILELGEEIFFTSDIRKKTEILEYVFYANYVTFKLFLRCGKAVNFIDFKEKVTIDKLFEINEYNSSVLKFIIDDIKNTKKYIMSELQNDKMYTVLIEKYERLERMFVENEKTIAGDSSYYEKLLKNENNICGISSIHNKQFSIPITTLIDMSEYNKDSNILTAKQYALFILRCINSNDLARMLVKFIEKISDDMTYKEFFFMCKIFNLHDIVNNIASSNGINSLTSQFEKLERKYGSIYSSRQIMQKKQKVLKHKNDTSNKYGKFIEVDISEIQNFCKNLDDISLDYHVNGEVIYLNMIYFNGFTNIQHAFSI